MIKKISFPICMALVLLLFASWFSVGRRLPRPLAIPSLRETFKNDFAIGTCINPRQVEESNSDEATLIPEQFNAVTPENIMKAEIIHPGWDRYDFDPADKLVAYAKSIT